MVASTAYADKSDFSFSLVVLGDSGVGKSLIVQMTQPQSGADAEASEPHFGVSRRTHTYESRGAVYQVHLWEVPGAPRYLQGASRYVGLAAGVLLVFDVNRRSTFERITQWLDAANANGSPLPMLLVGNKADMQRSPSRVRVAEAEAFAAQHGMQYFETSATTNEGVTEAISTLLAMVIGQIPNPPEPSLLLKTRIQIGRKLADNRSFRAALFDIPSAPSA